MFNILLSSLITNSIQYSSELRSLYTLEQKNNICSSGKINTTELYSKNYVNSNVVALPKNNKTLSVLFYLKINLERPDAIYRNWKNRSSNQLC
jgi:hypothetical protein